MRRVAPHAGTSTQVWRTNGHLPCVGFPMSYLLYVTGVIALISGTAWLATLAGLPAGYVSGGAMVLLAASLVPAGLPTLSTPTGPSRTLRSGSSLRPPPG